MNNSYIKHLNSNKQKITKKIYDIDDSNNNNNKNIRHKDYINYNSKNSTYRSKYYKYNFENQNSTSDIFYQKYCKYKTKYLDLKNNIIKGGALIASNDGNSISLIPDSEISQNIGAFRVEGEQSNCTYNAAAAIRIIIDNLADIQAIIGNIGSPETIAFFSGLWQNILAEGLVAFQSNQNRMLDPNELYNDGSIIDVEGSILDEQLGGPSIEQFVERLNQRQPDCFRSCQLR